MIWVLQFVGFGLIVVPIPIVLSIDVPTQVETDFIIREYMFKSRTLSCAALRNNFSCHNCPFQLVEYGQFYTGHRCNFLLCFQTVFEICTS
jgi:hypothetical protein